MQRRDLLSIGIGALAGLRPLAVIAQQEAMPVIGFLHYGSPGNFAPYVAAFKRGLNENGYVEGRNVRIEYRWAEGYSDRLPALATDLSDGKVDLIAAFGPASAFAAKNATATIPIVFVTGTDPVEIGLVASLSHPGSNLTGFFFFATELVPKRLELLSELVPNARVIALLVDPSFLYTARIIRDAQEAARAMGLQLIILSAGIAGEIDDAFGLLAQQHAGALLVAPSLFLDDRRDQLLALASRYAVPAMYQLRDYPVAGGLISYGPSLISAIHQTGIYAGRILKGANPGDLPVQQAIKFELVINLKTAKALGLTVPQSLLQRADEVIE